MPRRRPDRRVRELVRLRKAHEITVKAMAKVGNVHGQHWHNVECGFRRPGLPLLDAVAGAFGASVEVVFDHHRPFLDLDRSEAVALIYMAQDAKNRHPQPPEVLVTLANKLERHTRGGERRAKAA